MTRKAMTNHLENGARKDAASLHRAERAAVIACLKGYLAAFAQIENPGHSDLDNEQPISIFVPLGHLRKTVMLVHRLEGSAT